MIKKIKILISATLAGCLGFLLCLSASGGQVMLVGSKHVNKYHLSTCSLVKDISTEALVTFKSPEQAVNAGYIPCPRCNPPRRTNYFVTSHHSSVYHLPTCTIAQRMEKDDIIYFYSPESAAKAGYKSCQICVIKK